MKPRTSYLRGYTQADYYEAVGKFRGSLPAGFMASALLRWTKPEGDPGNLAVPWRAVCGNLQSGAAPNTTRGWALQLLTTQFTGPFLQFAYGDAAQALQTPLIALEGLSMSAEKSVLVDCFFGVQQGIAAPQLLIFVNGNLWVQPGAFPIGTGYAPADAANPFRIGRSEISGVQLDGDGIQVAGFAYFDGVPTGATAYADAFQIAAAHWNSVQLAQDEVATDVPQITDLFSVRQRLPQVVDGQSEPWASSIGSVTLDRIGTTRLHTLSSDPRWLDECWESP